MPLDVKAGWGGRKSDLIHVTRLVGKLNIKFNFSSLVGVSPALQRMKCKANLRLKELSGLSGGEKYSTGLDVGLISYKPHF